MANFTGLAAGRQQVARRRRLGRRPARAGRRPAGARAGRRRAARDARPALRYLGLGAPTVVPADDEGRLDAGRAGRGAGRRQRAGDRLPAGRQPALRRVRPARPGHRAGPRARRLGARRRRVRAVGGGAHRGCGTWSPGTRPPTPGRPTRTRRSTSRTTAGSSSSRRPALRAAMGDAGQLPRAGRAGDPVDTVPELSRRARGVPVWAALRSLGRSGVAELVDGLAANARAIAAGIAAIAGAEVLNDVVFTQVCAAFGDDERTRAVTARAARRRGHLDVRLALARSRRHAGLGEQLVHRRRRRGRRGRRRAPGRGRLTPAGHQPAPVCSASRNSSSSRITRSKVRSISGVAVVASTSRPSEASQIS